MSLSLPRDLKNLVERDKYVCLIMGYSELLDFRKTVSNPQNQFYSITMTRYVTDEMERRWSGVWGESYVFN